jgi:hypothetical protein
MSQPSQPASGKEFIRIFGENYKGRFYTHCARFGAYFMWVFAVTEQTISIQRQPLAGIFGLVLSEPAHLSLAVKRRWSGADAILSGQL